MGSIPSCVTMERCKAHYTRKDGKIFCDLESGHDGDHHVPTILVKITKKKIEKDLGRKMKYNIGSAMDILADWKI